MILTDKTYIEMPPDNTPLVHYLNIYQMLSILQRLRHLVFIISIFIQRCVGSDLDFTFLQGRYQNHLLWEDNTPVKKDEGYAFRVKNWGTDHEL